MGNKKLFTLIVSILMVLTVPFIIYGYNFNSVAFDEDFYKKEFLKYNVYENLKNYDIESINSDVLNYLKKEKNNSLMDNDFFNEREKTHLLDVKILISKVLSIYYFSVILFLLLFVLLIFSMKFEFQKIMKRFFIILLFGTVLTCIDAVLFLILSNFNFSFVFDLLHKTFFSLGTYIFDPTYENLVVLYPQNLFFDALIRIIISTIITSAVILLFSIMFLFIFFGLNFRNFFKNTDGKIVNRKL